MYRRPTLPKNSECGEGEGAIFLCTEDPFRDGSYGPPHSQAVIDVRHTARHPSVPDLYGPPVFRPRLLDAAETPYQLYHQLLQGHHIKLQ